MLIIGSQIWMRGTIFEQVVGSGDRWVTFDAEELAAANPGRQG